MFSKKIKLITAVGLSLVLSLMLVGGAVSASPEPAGKPSWTGIIAFDKGVSQSGKDAIIRSAGGVSEKHLEALDMTIVSLPSQAVAKGLEKAKGVLFVEEDSYQYYHDQPLPWGINRIDAKLVWDSDITGDGVNVAVLDTGIDTDHPDLALNLEGGYSCVNRDTSNIEDLNGHGTHTSGTIAALNNDFGVVGVGPDIDLYMVQLSKTGSIKITDIVEGINWCIATHSDGNFDNDIQVMSMSFGGGYSYSEDIALQNAYNHGIVLVASAGNSSGGAVGFPAALGCVIAVSAVDINDHIASFSSIGPQVELAAPGVSINSTYLGATYAPMSGTSMACPHVAGVAALVIAANPELSTPQVREILQITAEDIGLNDYQQGYGLVDAEKAVIEATNGMETGAIIGTVTDDTDTPITIAGATVTVEGINFSATTDGSGQYQINSIPVGTYIVTASAEGYQSLSSSATVNKDITTTVNFTLTENVTPTGDMTASISFSGKKAGKNLFLNTTVDVELKDGSPVSGAAVEMTLESNGSFWYFDGTTGSDGTVVFTIKTTAGSYTAKVTLVSCPGYDWDGDQVRATCTLDEYGIVSP